MQNDMILGCLVLAAALGLLTGLTAWSRRRIDRIARRGFGTAREIIKEMKYGR